LAFAIGCGFLLRVKNMPLGRALDETDTLCPGCGETDEHTTDECVVGIDAMVETEDARQDGAIRSRSRPLTANGNSHLH
jgi:hypothetical protein